MLGKIVKHSMEIHVRPMWDRGANQLYLWQREDNGDLSVFTIETTEFGAQLIGRRIERDKLQGGAVAIDSIPELKPFLTLAVDTYREVLSAMMRLGESENVPRPSEDHLKGKLEATQEHLEDMRTIVFKTLSRGLTEPTK